MPVGVETIDAVERQYVVFKKRDWRVGGFGDCLEVLRAVSGRGRS
jgi:hypothetical protein